MRTSCIALAAALLLLLGSVPANAYDRSEALSCTGCHYFPAQDVIIGWWLTSSHANSMNDHNGNTYCAGCHSPFQADPLATHDDNQPIPVEDWEAVTCSSCHPPHELRVQWGTPIGTYDVDSGDWSPAYDANELCQHCHTGSRHTPDFQAQGKLMFEHKGVECIDCHMAKRDTGVPDAELRRSHTFRVEENLPYSCGTYAGGCHESHKTEWAAKQIAKGKIHGKEKKAKGPKDK